MYGLVRTDSSSLPGHEGVLSGVILPGDKEWGDICCSMERRIGLYEIYRRRGRNYDDVGALPEE